MEREWSISELVAVGALVSSIFAGVNYVVGKIMIEPRLRKAAREIRGWCSNSLVPKTTFESHCQIQAARDEEIEREFRRVWETLESKKPRVT